MCDVSLSSRIVPLERCRKARLVAYSHVFTYSSEFKCGLTYQSHSSASRAPLHLGQIFRRATMPESRLTQTTPQIRDR